MIYDHSQAFPPAQQIVWNTLDQVGTLCLARHIRGHFTQSSGTTFGKHAAEKSEYRLPGRSCHFLPDRIPAVLFVRNSQTD